MFFLKFLASTAESASIQRMETTTNTRVGFVCEDRLPELDERVAKVNKQAKKLGLPGMSYTKTGNAKDVVVKTFIDNFGETHKEYATFVEVEIHGDIPKLPGDWDLLAAINHEEGLPIVKCVPGKEIPLEQRGRGSICDHCQTKRARKDTF